MFRNHGRPSYRPVFIGVAPVALLFTWRRVWRSAIDCSPGEVCDLPQVKRAYELLFGIVAALAFPHLASLF
ncbi:mercuric transporter MerT family protein [Rhodoferax ferrireducens]|uniref:mercuric transporter MerT family protein n=1 Tax=Rhodoferax ferrireducens TaxID=192843 RepID=UPI000E0D3239|nr:mercuric transporter MerT family protein [Rhodoferax ferrireducens]